MNYIKFIRIFLLVLIIIGLGLLATQKMWVPRVVDMIVKNENNAQVSGITKDASKQGTFEWCMEHGGKDVTENFNAPKKCLLKNKVYINSCVDNDNYFVVSKGEGFDVGSDILIKYKSSPSQRIQCEYNKKDGDFEIKNELAEYVMALEKNFLIIDSGTGPEPRDMLIYDLNLRKKIFSDSYLGPVEIKDGIINYWTETKKSVTKENCPEYWSQQYDGIIMAAIDTHVSLNLLTQTKKELGEYRCSARQ